MKLINIPSFTDNYIWLLHNDTQCIIIDPGEYKPVFQKLRALNLTPIAIFLTHYHNDHIAGIPELLEQYKIPVYGPQKVQKNIITFTKHEDTINILKSKFKIISLPGHTPEHIGFYNHPWLFSGDTIFSAGCGKIYEGAEKTMYQSLQKIKKLNQNTLICASHEYTLSNIQFAISIIPQDKYLTSYEKYIKKIRNKNQASLPSKLQNELKINLFLRCHETILKTTLGFHPDEEEWKVFSKLRKKKQLLIKIILNMKNKNIKNPAAPYSHMKIPSHYHRYYDVSLLSSVWFQVDPSCFCHQEKILNQNKNTKENQQNKLSHLNTLMSNTYLPRTSTKNTNNSSTPPLIHLLLS